MASIQRCLICYLQVCVFDLKDDMELQMECSYYNTILALYLKCKGDFVLVRICCLAFLVESGSLQALV